MRIMVDTNVIISVILFPTPKMNELVKIITQEHELVLSSFVIDELVQVVKRKFPGKERAIDRFLSEFPYEMVYTPKDTLPTTVTIRDPKDYPVLYTAIVEDADILITGDKDFADVEIEKPEILTPAQFLEKYSAQI